MAHLIGSVEYGLHCLKGLAGSGDAALSSRGLAEPRGIPPSFLARMFPKLEKAGLVCAGEGIGGGRPRGAALARPEPAGLDRRPGERPPRRPEARRTRLIRTGCRQHA